MSKLEEKLAASITPDSDKSAAPAPKAAARSRPAGSKASAGNSKVPNLNDPKRPLHPSRIWPD